MPHTDDNTKINTEQEKGTKEEIRYNDHQDENQ